MHPVSQPSLAVNHACQFAHRHSVTYRQGIEPHKTAEFGFQNVALHRYAVQRIGAIQHHERDALLGSGFHSQSHGVDVGVVTHPDVLDVEHQDIHIL